MLQVKQNHDQASCKEVFSREEASQYLRISLRFLDGLAAEGKLIRTKIGKRAMFLRSDLNQYLYSCREVQQ